MKKFKRFQTVVLFFSITFFSSFGQTLHVPLDYPAIQAAINAAQKGDTVLVDTGRYYENINFRGKSIVLTSKYILSKDTSFISKTIIDGSKPTHPDTASCVLLTSAEDSSTFLIGFTLTNGGGTKINGYVEGGGVLLKDSHATIRNNIIIQNNVAAGGGGIASWGGKCTILDNIIAGNTAGYAAGIVLNWGDGIIKNNIIYHNKKIGGSWLTGGLMVWDSPGNPIIENNTIIGNTSSTTAGGISITSSSNPVLINNIVWGNRQRTGEQVTGAKKNMVTFCNLENTIAGEGNISAFPLFQDSSFNLSVGSPCIDAGLDSIVYNDNNDSTQPGQALIPSMGTTRNDMGAFGGPGAELINKIFVEDLYAPSKIDFGFGIPGTPISKSFDILNLGTSDLKIDSIKLGPTIFKLEKGNDIKTIGSLKNDTITVSWTPGPEGIFTDTLKIYHSIKSVENPEIVIIKGTVLSAVSKINSNYNKKEIINVYPNPFKTNCIIRYRVNVGSQVKLNLYDINGRKIYELANSRKNPGNYQVELDRTNLKSGIYFLQYVSGLGTLTEKLIID